MTIEVWLGRVRRVFLDTAPIIYYVEKNDRYAALLCEVFDRIDREALTAVTSPITLAECLVVPIRLRKTKLARDFGDLLFMAAIPSSCPSSRTPLHAQRS